MNEKLISKCLKLVTTQVEWHLVTIFGIVIIFWAIFKLNGTALTTYAKSYTNREIPTAIVPVANALHICDNSIVAKNDSTYQLDSQFRRIKSTDGVDLKCVAYPDYFKNCAQTTFPDFG